MVNTNKLKGRMRELNITQREAAKALLIDESTFNRKINNRKGSSFTVSEANSLASLLGLSMVERGDYFFYSPTCVSASKE